MQDIHERALTRKGLGRPRVFIFTLTTFTAAVLTAIVGKGLWEILQGKNVAEIELLVFAAIGFVILLAITVIFFMCMLFMYIDRFTYKKKCNNPVR